jgi:hypothetical protein
MGDSQGHDQFLKRHKTGQLIAHCRNLILAAPASEGGFSSPPPDSTTALSTELANPKADRFENVYSSALKGLHRRITIRAFPE